MKKLGITDSGNELSFKNYVDWFTDHDKAGDIEILKLAVGSNDYKSCSGILLSGGVDVNPEMYDGDAHYENQPEEFNDDRDNYEQEVYKYAKINKIPILAICRGLQLVNVVEGGTLIQDLSTGNATHKKENGEDKQHSVAVDSRTLLGDITGAMSGEVNSAHHQAVDPEAVAKPLLINATSKDNVIEGLEFKDKTNKGFMVAVQWHPERMKDKETNSLSKNLKKAFLSAIRSI